MIWNHLKTGWRVISKDLAFTTINIVGLSTGLAIALLIIMYGRYELSYENTNPMAERVVRVTMDYLNGQTVIDQDAETYPPLGPRVKADLKDVIEFSRAQDLNESTLEIDGAYFRVGEIYAVDPSFLDLLHYPLLAGQRLNLFNAPNEAVVPLAFVEKYYDDQDVIGKTFKIIGFDQPFVIRGLIDDSPINTHLKIKLLISYSTLNAVSDNDGQPWKNNNLFTYLLLEENASLANVDHDLSLLSDLLIEEEKIVGERVIAQPINDIHLRSDKSYEPEAGGDASSVFILLGVALLVILIAIVNYINLSTSKSLDRAKEVGIRKVVGSSTGQLRLQFFTESLLINLFAGGCALVWIVMGIERFKDLADLPGHFGIFSDAFFWGALLTAVAISSLLSGIFPAMILSSFQPLKVLKGRLSNAHYGVKLRQGLVIFQFAITTFMLIQTLTVAKQIDYMQSMDIGVNVDQTLVVQSPQGDSLEPNFARFKEQLLGQADIESVALSSTVPGLPTNEMGSTTGVNLVGEMNKHNFNFYLYWMDADFIPTLKMELLAGSNFLDMNQNSDQVIVNEESIRLWGIPSPEAAIGQKIDLWGQARTIIGVVKSFNQVSAKSPFIPLIFHYDKNNGDFASIRMHPSDVEKQLAAVEDIYHANFANSPFDFFFLDKEFDKQYRSDQQFQAVFRLLSGFAILIACLGLFGLVSFTISRRSKEIGIRKVLGANLGQIITLLSRDFVWLILSSILLAVPITYFVIDRWLLQYAFRIDLSIWLFIIPAGFILGISVITILVRTLQFSVANPAASLRDE